MRRYYDNKTKRWQKPETKVPCVSILDYAFKLRNQDQPGAVVNCYSIVSPAKTASSPKSHKTEYRWKTYAVAADGVRHRTLSTPGGIESVDYFPVGDVSHLHPGWQQFWIVQPQTVVDEYASALTNVSEETATAQSLREERGERAWHPFQHYVRKMENHILFPFNYATRFYGPDYNDWASSHHEGVHGDPFWMFRWGSGVPGDYDSVLTGLPEMNTYQPGSKDFIPWPDGIGGLTEASLNAMLPRIRAETSGLNSLYELKDFASLPHTLERLATTAGRLGNLQFKVLARSARDLGWRGFLKQGASDFLEWKFNVAPFISDVQAVRSALVGIKSQIMRNLRNASQVQTRHYARSFRELEAERVDTQTSRVFVDPDECIISVTRSSYSDLTKFHAECEFYYYYSPFQQEYALLLGFLDAVGVNLNPATIWRAIPYTWLVDFVFGIGRWLDRLKLRNMEPTLRVDRYLFSVLRRRRTNVVVRRHSSYPINGEDSQSGTVLPTISEIAYGRWTELPDRTSYDTMSDVTPMEFTLASALALSRTRRRVKKQLQSRWFSNRTAEAWKHARLQNGSYESYSAGAKPFVDRRVKH